MSEFIQRHIGPTLEEQSKMLDDLGVSTIDELVRQSYQIQYYFVVMMIYQNHVVNNRHLKN